MIPRLRELLRNRSGAAAIEFAILLPVALLLLFGTYEVTNAVVTYMKLTAAVDTVGDLVAQQTSVSSAMLDDFYKAEQLVMSPASTSGLGFAVASVTFSLNTTSNTVQATQAWQQTRGSATSMTDAATSSTNLGGNGESVIVTQATYTYNSLLKYVLPKGIVMSQRIYTRPRTAPSIPFTN
ncbi:MAG TPA: TadE/TadG family type IV pilus assembly protein [Aliidongia sp.]|nr:TadE/TadG family type IV pilus assembly protein [Aliidongia sp.]